MIPFSGLVEDTLNIDKWLDGDGQDGSSEMLFNCSSHSSYDHDFYAVGLTGLVTFHLKGKKSFELLFEHGFNPDPLNSDTVNIWLVAIL